MRKTHQTHEKPWYRYKHHHFECPTALILPHYGFGFHIGRHLGFLRSLKHVQLCIFQIFIYVIFICVYYLFTMLKKCTTSLKTWNFHYRTERNIQPINMVHYIDIFFGHLPSSKISWHRILQYMNLFILEFIINIPEINIVWFSEILQLQSLLYNVNSYFTAILAAILKKKLDVCYFSDCETALLHQ